MAGDDAVGHLAWAAGRSSLATGETVAGKWTIKRLGFLSPKVLIRDAATGKDVGALELHWRSSQFRLQNGHTYRLTHKGRLIPTWEFQDQNGARTVHIEAVREETKLAGGLVSVAAGATTNPDITLLLLVGWYFVVMEWAEEEAEAVTDSTLVAWSG